MAPQTRCCGWKFRVFICVLVQIIVWSSLAEGKKHKLKHGDMDSSRLIILNTLEKNITIWVQSKECYTCDLMPEKVVQREQNYSLILDTRWPTRLAVTHGNLTYCHEAMLSRHFQEHGEYNLWVLTLNDSMITCTGPILLNDPLDSNIPIYAAVGILLLLALFWILLKYLHRNHYLYKLYCCFSTERLLDPVGIRLDLGIPPSINPGDEAGGDQTKTKSRERLKSLDTFRGIAITVMIFADYGGGGYWFFKHTKWNGLSVADLVFPCLSLTIMILANYGGGGYWFLDHSIWNGLTVADMVFPWFVYIMGTALAMSFRSQLRKANSKRHMFFRIVKRSIILFVLGLLINTGPGHNDMTKLRIPGVLQRFAITYLVVASAHLFCARVNDSQQYKWWSSIRDLTDYWPEWVLELLFVGIWTGLTFGMAVPGCPTGYLGAGGMSDHGLYVNCTGGAAGYIDRWIFGNNHIYPTPTCKEVFDTIAYDPEGTLGTLTSFLMCFLGLQVGKILLTFEDWVQRTKRFLIWAVLLLAMATTLCKASMNDGWIPINKNLWTLSFVLLLSGFAFVLFTFCYLTIDVWKIWTGAPFYYPGMNSILLYVGHELLEARFPIQFHVEKQHAQMLAMSLWGTSFFVVASYVLFRKKLFFTV